MAAKNKEEGVDSHLEVQSPQGPLEAQFSGDRALGGGGGGLPRGPEIPVCHNLEQISSQG